MSLFGPGQDSLSVTIDVTDATLGVSSLWLGTRTGAGSSPWLNRQQELHYPILFFVPLFLLADYPQPHLEVRDPI